MAQIFIIMNEEKPKKQRKKKAAAGEDGGGKEHKPNWREYMATVEDIQTFLAGTVLLRHNAITGRPEFRVPMQDELETLGMTYPTGARPLDEWRSASEWQPVCDRLVNTLWQMLKTRKEVSRTDKEVARGHGGRMDRRGGGEQLHPRARRTPGNLQDHLVQFASST